MRKPVLIACLAVIALSLALLWFKQTDGPKMAEPKPVVISPSHSNGLAQKLPTSRSVTASSIVKSQPEPASSTNSVLTEAAARLLAQIQTDLKSDDASDHMRVFDELLPTLVKLDPAAAVAFTKTPGLENWRSEMMRVVAQRWADRSPAEALAWAAQLADPVERDAAIGNVSLQAGETDPAWAIQALEQQGAGSSPMLENLVQRWADKDFIAASDWVANQPSGEDRDRLVARLALTQSLTAPASAARTVVEQMAAGTAQNDAALMVLNQWAMQDLPGATSWANKFPAGDLSNQARQLLSGMVDYQAKSKMTP